MMYCNNFIAVVKCNGEILREKQGNVVYLPFGSDYSIFLKNNEARRALVDIEVDGKKVFKGKLIMEANSSQEIFGFMKDMNKSNKFKFIHKTDEIKNHRGDFIEDGSIRIEYQFEEVVNEPVIYYPPSIKYYGFYYDTTSVWGSDISTKSLDNNIVSASMTSTYCCNSFNGIEDGITVKGSKIDSNYKYGDIGTLSDRKDVITILLKGRLASNKKISKPVTVKTKLICSTCGRKNKSNNSFCYNCGTCLE